MYSHRIYILLFILLISLLSCTSINPTAAVPEEGGLFIESTNPGTLPAEEDPTIMRTRYIEINLDQLDNAQAGTLITLNLFKDAVFIFVVDEKVINDDGSYSLIGHIKDAENSSVTLVVGGGQLAGNIVLPDAIYQVRYAGGNVHAVHQIDQSGFPPEAEPVVTD